MNSLPNMKNELLRAAAELCVNEGFLDEANAVASADADIERMRLTEIRWKEHQYKREARIVLGGILEEAADEIERLRKALLQIRSYIDCPEHYNKHIDNIIDAAVGPEMPIFVEGCDNLSGYKLEGK